MITRIARHLKGSKLISKQGLKKICKSDRCPPNNLSPQGTEQLAAALHKNLERQFSVS